MYVFIAEDDGIIGSEYMLFSHLFSKIIPRSCEIKQTSKMKFILCCYHNFDIGILIISFYRLFSSQFIPQSVSTHKNCIFMCLFFLFLYQNVVCYTSNILFVVCSSSWIVLLMNSKTRFRFRLNLKKKKSKFHSHMLVIFMIISFSINFLFFF